MKKHLLVISVLFVFLVISCTTTGEAAGGGGGGGAKQAVAVKLKAEDAKLETASQLTLEIKDTGNNVGWWSSTDDKVSWEFEVAEEAEYTIVGKMSCAESFKGAKVVLSIDGEKVTTFEVPSTSDWSSYTMVEFGKATVSAGSHTLMLQAESIANRFVMNLQEVRFLK